MSRRSIAVLLPSLAGEQVGTALRLTERLLARGHRVAVFAHGEGACLSAGTDEMAAGIAALLRRGVHGGTLDWVVDGDAARRHGLEHQQAAGVVIGDHADLWAFVRESDVVLSVPVGGAA